MTVIDIHSHFFPAITRQAAATIGDQWPWLRIDDSNAGMIMQGDEEFRPVHSTLWDVGRRVEELDEQGIDVQIICATPILFGYARARQEAADAAAMINDEALLMCASAPDRLKALCQVPLQDTDLACAEVSRAMKAGHVGVQIGNHVGDRDLDDEGLVTFLHHCADIGAPVLVHPWDMLGRDRMKKYMLQWLVAMPAETQLSILYLILSGAFERLPENLKICFAHGGGSFAYILGRVDNAWTHRDIVRKDCPKLPSSYVNRFYVDSAVFSQESLKLLVDVMGDDHVMYGSDYPFPLGEQDMCALVNGHPDLTQTARENIKGQTALNFFNL